MKAFNLSLSIAAVALSCALFTSPALAEERTRVSSAPLPEYRPAALPAASLTSVGSDSMDDLVRVWVEAYRKHQPGVAVQVVSRGSATAPAALIEGSADFGPMSRPMKSVEQAEFVAKYGFAPTQVRTALAAVGVYVPKDNPLKKISFEQLGKIYAATAEGTEAAGPISWEALGVTTTVLRQSPVAAIARTSDSYLHGYFRQRVLHQRPFAAEVMTTADSSSMLQALEHNPNAIAFGEVLPATDGVRLVPVSRTEKEKAVLPDKKSIAKETYPLTRYLSIYLVREPHERLDASVSDFLHFVLSREGQEIVETHGLIPLPPEVAAAELKKLQ